MDDKKLSDSVDASRNSSAGNFESSTIPANKTNTAKEGEQSNRQPVGIPQIFVEDHSEPQLHEESKQSDVEGNYNPDLFLSPFITPRGMEIYPPIDEIDIVLEERRNKKPLYFCQKIADNPKIWFWSLLAANIFFIIFSIALHFAGTGVFDNQFGTLNLVVDHNLSYLREAIWKIHFWPEVGLLDHDFHFLKLGYRDRIVERFDVIFESLYNNNLFTAPTLKDMRYVEDYLFNNSQFQSTFCLTQEVLLPNGSFTLECRKPLSVLRLFDGTFESEGFPLDYTFENITSTIMRARNNAKTLPIIRTCLPTFTLFSNERVFANSTLSSIFFGGPLQGYSSFGDREIEQNDIRVEWYIHNWVPQLRDWYEYGVNNVLRVLYGTAELTEWEIQEQAYLEVVFCFVSILFVDVWMTVQLQSVLIANVTALCMLSTAFSSNLIYRFVFKQTYFGVIHLFSIVLMYSVTADQIFVFFNAWRDSEKYKFLSLAHRLSFAYSKITLSTMAVTTMSLVVTSLGELPTTRAYGRLTLIQFAINFLFMTTMLPSVVLIYHLYVEKYTCLCFFERDPSVLHNYYDRNEDIPTATFQLTYVDHTTGQTVSRLDTRQSVYLTLEELQRVPPKQFEVTKQVLKWHHALVTHSKGKWLVLLLSVVVLVFFTYFASTVNITTEEVQVLEKTTNAGAFVRDFHNFYVWKYFPVTVVITWGLLDPDLENCDHDDLDCYSKKIFNQSFSLEPEDVQRQLLEFCNKIRFGLTDEEKHLLRVKLDHKNDTSMSCFMNSLTDFYQNRSEVSVNFPFGSNVYNEFFQNRATDVFKLELDSACKDNGVDLAYFYFIHDGFPVNFLKKPTYIREYGDYVGASRTDCTKNTSFGQGGAVYSEIFYGTDIRMIAISIDLDVDPHLIPLEESSKLRDAWDRFVSNELPSGLRDGKHFTPGGHNDINLWHWVTVLQDLLVQVVMEIALTLIFSILFSVLGSSNFITGLVGVISILATITSTVGMLTLIGENLHAFYSLGLVFCIGLAVDYGMTIAHAYSMSPHPDREGRLHDAIEDSATSLVEGFVSTFVAGLLLFPCQIEVLSVLGELVCIISVFSMFYTFGLLCVLLLLFGPEGDSGDIGVFYEERVQPILAKMKRCCCSCLKKRKEEESARESAEVVTSEGDAPLPRT